MAGNVPEGAGGAAMHSGGLSPSQAGQVQLVHILQEVALQELQQCAQEIVPGGWLRLYRMYSTL